MQQLTSTLLTISLPFTVAFFILRTALKIIYGEHYTRTTNYNRNNKKG